MMQHHPPVRLHAFLGFGLIEILISLVILSFALLGLASIQIQAIKINATSNNATYAQILANDMSNRIRANAIEAIKGNQSAYTQIAEAFENCHTPSSNQACTASEMAKNDLYEWQAQIANLLPNGKGIVCVDSALSPGSLSNPDCDGQVGSLKRLVIKLWWEEYNATDNETQQAHFITQVQPWQ